MPGLEQNQQVWNEVWDWSEAGEEWSRSWGGTPALWFGAIHPRIGGFLPAGTILEIAPGFGRWTEYLRRHCERLILVDLTPKCIEHCRARFAGDRHIEYHVNDGLTLGTVEDHSVDFAFSFDSLVHVDRNVLRSYLTELSRVLKPDGVGFIHHSNAGRYRVLPRVARRVPEPYRRRLIERGALLDLYAWRSEDVSVDSFARLCRDAGLVSIAQEQIVWERGPYLTDAFSVFTPRDSTRVRPRVSMENRHFRAEARRLGSLYSR
jgi:ubiquinone/menaquinone biosynthesis C-methylase UbiE